MAHRTGGRTYNLYLSVQPGIGSGLSCGHRDMGPPIDHTGGVKLGSQKGVILAARNEPKFGVHPIVYLHAGLEIGSAILYPIHQESNKDSHAPGSQRSLCHVAW